MIVIDDDHHDVNDNTECFYWLQTAEQIYIVHRPCLNVVIHYEMINMCFEMYFNCESDVLVCMSHQCVCRWVKWTSTDIYSDHSLMSTCLITCLWLMMTTCWSRTSTIIAFCCSAWTLNYSYNASSLTTLNSSSGGQHDYVTVHTQLHCCMFYTAAVGSGLTRSRYSVCPEWVTYDCSNDLLYQSVSDTSARRSFHNSTIIILHWNHINDIKNKT